MLFTKFRALTAVGVTQDGRCFKTRRKEHQRNLKNYARGLNIANHAWQNNHSINFEGATVIDKGNYRVRRTLESWHTAKIQYF